MALVSWLQKPYTAATHPNLLRCQEIIFGFRLPTVYDSPRIQRSLPTPETLACQLQKQRLPLPPPNSGIDVTVTDCALIHFNKRWYAILPEHNKGYGLWTVDDLQPGVIVGKYDGYHCDTKCSDGPYVMSVQHGWIDADPCLAPEYYNGIPVGWKGDALLAYINEPSNEEVANVVYCEKDGGVDCYVVVGPDGACAWHPLLVCYSSCGKAVHFHDCTQTQCKRVVYWAQIDFVSQDSNTSDSDD